jgi:hypothetical protein
MAHSKDTLRFLVKSIVRRFPGRSGESVLIREVWDAMGPVLRPAGWTREEFGIALLACQDLGILALSRWDSVHTPRSLGSEIEYEERFLGCSQMRKVHLIRMPL